MPDRDDLFADFEADATRDAGRLFVDLVADYMARTGRREGAVSTPLTQAEIAPRFAEPLPMKGQPLHTVAARIARDIMADANRLQHPMYLGHQVGGALPAPVWMEVVIAALNNSIAVTEMSPTGTPVEKQVIRWLVDLAGFPAGSGGVMTSGGTEATFTALLAARAHALPDAWRDGIPAEAPVVVCGEHAHYSTTRAVAQLGLGARRTVVVESRDWRMDVDALSRTLDSLERGRTKVMAVVATAGSTATGAFDDLDAIGALCEARGLWLHVDGAHGASALLSSAHRHRMRGVERARTLAWDPHKMMLVPLSGGALLARAERDLDAAFDQRAPYLFHEEGEVERSPDQGVRSFMCSRRADALKVWVAIQRYGVSGLAGFYDHLCAVAARLHDEIRASSDFVAVHEPESNILCFRWIGGRRLSDEDRDRANQAIRERYNRSGRGWVTSTVLGGRRVLRVTVASPRSTDDDVRELLIGLREVAASIS